jgi:hypothetical protein
MHEQASRANRLSHLQAFCCNKGSRYEQRISRVRLTNQASDRFFKPKYTENSYANTDRRAKSG